MRAKRPKRYARMLYSADVLWFDRVEMSIRPRTGAWTSRIGRPSARGYDPGGCSVIECSARERPGTLGHVERGRQRRTSPERQAQSQS